MTTPIADDHDESGFAAGSGTAVYEKPSLTVLGTLAELTQGDVSGDDSDGVFNHFDAGSVGTS
jgi:hypothetical protein